MAETDAGLTDQDVIAAGGGGASAPAPATPSPSAPASTPAPSPAATPAAGPQTSTAAQGQGDFLGVRDALRSYGLDPSGFQDDHAALQQLALAYQQSRQLQPLAQYGQVYLQHATEFEAWRRQQAEAAQQAQQAQQKKEPWWKAPEWNPAWERMIVQDPVSREYRPAAGAPPDVVQKYTQALQHQREFLQKFSQDPIAAIKPGIEEVAREIAGQYVQQHMGSFQERQNASSFVQENSSWLHVRDEQDNLVRDQQGRPVLSQWGQRFAGHVRQAEQMGLHDTQSQQQHAMLGVQRDFLLWRQQQQSQQLQQLSQGEQAKQQFMQQAAANRPNQSGSLQTPSPNGTTPVSQNPSLDIGSRLRGKLTAAGFNLSNPFETGR